MRPWQQRGKPNLEQTLGSYVFVPAVLVLMLSYQCVFLIRFFFSIAADSSWEPEY